MVTVYPSTKELDTLRELIEAGEIKPVIDRQYPLSDVAEAFRYLEEGNVKGKVVLSNDLPTH